MLLTLVRSAYIFLGVVSAVKECVMRNFNSKQSRARSEAVVASVERSLKDALFAGSRFLQKGAHVRRKVDGKIFTVSDHTVLGLRFMEVQGLFAPEFFEKVR